MASTRQLKSRIRSVKNTRQITKAMELVSASKMRRAQEATKATEMYSNAARELLTRLGDLSDTSQHPLFKQRAVKSRLLIVVTSDKGLAGAYNSNVLRLYLNELKKDRANNIETKTIAIGRKGAQFASRTKDVHVLGAYQDFPEYPTWAELRSIMRTIVDEFETESVDAVDILFTEYVNSISQVAKSQRLLPAGFDEIEVNSDLKHAEFEPSTEVVLEAVTKRLVESQLFQALLDSQASEQSMRMVAMKNASDNAGDIISDLTLEMNKVRQAGITQELSEISAGVESMK